jgi:predicted Na+-dependent transporter
MGSIVLLLVSDCRCKGDAAALLAPETRTAYIAARDQPATSGASWSGMKASAAWCERFLLPLVLAAAVLGLSWSGPGRRSVDHHGINAALAVLVAAVGFGLPASALADARRQWRRVAVAVVVPLAALPAIAWAASRIVAAGPLRLGVLAAGVAPSEVASVALAALGGGSAALAAAVLVGSTAACVLLAGPILHAIDGNASRFSSTSLLVSHVEIVAVPLVAAALIRTRISHGADDRADAASSLVASVAVLVLIWLVASQAHLTTGYVRVSLALVAFVAGSAALGALLTSRLSRPDRLSLLLPVAMRDFAIAAGIASSAFGAPAAAALGVYGVVVLLLGALTAKLSAP